MTPLRCYESYVTGNRERCCQTSSQAVDRSLVCSLTCCGKTSPGSLCPRKMYDFYNGNGVTDRKSRDKWEKEGSLDIRARALAMAKKLLSGPKPSYISEETDKAIREKFNILI